MPLSDAPSTSLDVHQYDLQAVRRETLRLRNVVPQIQRVAAADLALGGYQVPQGTALLLPLNHLNKHDPRWITDQPDTFRYVWQLG